MENNLIVESEYISYTSKILKAISNEKRLEILLYLIQNEELTVTQLEHKVQIGQSALSQHLARLRRDSIVVDRRSAQSVYYSIKDEKIAGLLEFLSTCLKD